MSAPLEYVAATSGKCFIEAPAGCGKTQFIVNSVKDFCGGRELVLTHTYAGIQVLRNRFNKEKVDKSKYKIDTIDGFCLMLVSSYPSSGNLSQGAIGDEINWALIHKAFLELIKNKFIEKVLTVSYKGLFVDEYQDCSILQHKIILALANLIPTRVLGDPLQSIFDFRSDDPVINWERDVEGNFNKIGELTTPYRWIKAGNQDLGKWLLEYVRPIVKRKEGFDFQRLPPKVTVKKLAGDKKSFSLQQVKFCRWFPVPDGENIVLISGGSNVNVAKAFSKKLAGAYYLAEPIENSELILFAKEYDACSPNSRCFHIVTKLKAWVSNAGKCFSSSIFKGRLPPAVPRNERIRELFSFDKASSHVTIMEMFWKHPKCNVHRREAFLEILRSLRSLSNGTYPSLLEALKATRERTRRNGKPLPRKLIGRTLLIKGLEFDHAVILNFHLLKPFEQYVALTRASKSITIFTT